MENEYDRWNKIKKSTNKNITDFYFREQEIWWCKIGLNIGTEINGKNKQFERPVLILKKFNKFQFWGIPVTSKPKNNKLYQEIKIRNIIGNEYISYINLSQLKALSTKRLIRNLGTLITDKKIIKNKVVELLKNENPTD